MNECLEVGSKREGWREGERDKDKRRILIDDFHLETYLTENWTICHLEIFSFLSPSPPPPTQIIKREKEWKEGAAKALLLKIFEALGPQNEVTKKGRQRMTNYLFL